nr:MAG TPA: hypothetical protein [Caudoviricetes sp.]
MFIFPVLESAIALALVSFTPRPKLILPVSFGIVIYMLPCLNPPKESALFVLSISIYPSFAKSLEIAIPSGLFPTITS